MSWRGRGRGTAATASRSNSRNTNTAAVHHAAPNVTATNTNRGAAATHRPLSGSVGRSNSNHSVSVPAGAISGDEYDRRLPIWSSSIIPPHEQQQQQSAQPSSVLGGTQQGIMVAVGGRPTPQATVPVGGGGNANRSHHHEPSSPTFSSSSSSSPRLQQQNRIAEPPPLMRVRGGGASNAAIRLPANTRATLPSSSTSLSFSSDTNTTNSSSTAYVRRLDTLNATLNRIRNTVETELSSHHNRQREHAAMPQNGGGSAAYASPSGGVAGGDVLVSVGNRELLTRAQRLTERLETLKRKLALCYEHGDRMAQMREGVARIGIGVGESGGRGHGNVVAGGGSDHAGDHADDGFEPYDPAAFLFAEAQNNYHDEQQQHQAAGNALAGSTTARTFLLTPQAVLEQMASVESDDAPPDFICPITQCIMVDPVFIHDGSIYERAAITEWFRSFQLRGKVPTSPLTNLELPDLHLTPCPELRREIQKFLDDCVQKQKDAVVSHATKNTEEKTGGALPPHPSSSSALSLPAVAPHPHPPSSSSLPPKLDSAASVSGAAESSSSAAASMPASLVSPPPSFVPSSSAVAAAAVSSSAAVASSSPPAPIPSYDSRTIDIGELRRAFQREQKKKEEREKEEREREEEKEAARQRANNKMNHLVREGSGEGEGEEGMPVGGGGGRARGVGLHHRNNNNRYNVSSNNAAVASILSSDVARTLDPAIIALLTREYRGADRGGRGGAIRVTLDRRGEGADDESDAERLAATSPSALLLADGPSPPPSSSHDEPIWGSSVVPLHEPNSRMLNLLRVRDDYAIPDNATLGGAGGVGGRGGGAGRGEVPANHRGDDGEGFVSSTVNHSRTIQRLQDARRLANTNTANGSSAAGAIEQHRNRHGMAAVGTSVNGGGGGGSAASPNVPSSSFPNDLYRVPIPIGAAHNAAANGRSLNARQGGRR